MAGGLPKQELFGFDLIEYATDVQKVTNAINGLVESLLKIKDIPGGLTELNKVSKEQIANAKLLVQYENELNKLRKSAADALIKEEKARKEAANAISAEERSKQSLIRTQKLEEQQRNKITVEERKTIAIKKLIIQAQQTEKGSINQLIIVNKILYEKTKGLNVLIPEQAKKYELLNRAINRNQQRMGQMAGTVHKGTRQFNMLQWQIMQVSREMPAFAYGINVGIGALSNNLPMLFDEINNVRKANKLLIAEGKPATSVLKQIAGSIFSWQTALVAVVTIVTMYGKDIGNWIERLGKSKKAIDGLNEGIRQNTEAAKSASEELKKETIQMKLRFLIASDNSKADKIRQKAYDELNSKYPEILDNLEKENGFIVNSKGNYEKLTEAIKKSLEARFAEEQIVKNYQEIAKQQKIIEKGGTFWGDITRTMQVFNNTISLGLLGNKMYLGDISKAEEMVNKLTEANRKLFETFTNGMKGNDDDPYKINAAKKDFDIYSKLISNETKNIFAERSNFINSDIINYESWLKKQLILNKDNVNARIAIEQKLFDLIEKRRKEDEKETKTELQIQKETNEKSLAEFKRSKQIELAENAKTTSKFIENEDILSAALEEQKYEYDIAILNEEKRLQEELLKIVKNGSTERASVMTDIEKINAEIAKRETKRRIQQIDDETNAAKKQAKELIADQKRQAKELSDTTISTGYAGIDQKQLDEQQKLIDDITAGIVKGNDKIEEKYRDLQLGMIKIEMDGIKKMIDSGNLLEDEKTQQYARLLDLQKQYNDKTIDNSKVVNGYLTEEQKKTVSALGEIIGQGFQLRQSFYQKELEEAQHTYDVESKYAGNNVEQKIIAEKKLQAEQKKIKRKEAIANKLEAIFNIGLQIALANAKLNFIQVAAAVAALATVVATPIPEYELGTKETPETFIAGDKKGSKGASELILTPDGKAILTPNKPTLFSDKSFIGSTVLSHDKTQNWLANLAVNSTYDVIDMSETNSYLKNINKNTKNKSKKEIDYLSNGTKVIKRVNITTYIK
jgi:hypothetical protein